MRRRLDWDVLFVLEDQALRRESDLTHFRMANQLHRTLITLDRDYLDDRRFPPNQSSGVLVISAPNAQQFEALLSRIHRVLFTRDRGEFEALPLIGRTLEVHTDWQRGEP